MFLTLMYHHIDSDIDADTAVAEEAFESQLDFLLKTCAVLSLSEAIQVTSGAIKTPKRAVLLTFDDAYSSVFSEALPRLQARNMPASLFVISKYVGQSNRWELRSCFDAMHMSWEQLSAWAEAGYSIGGHSHDHSCLVRLTDEEIAKTIELNKLQMQSHLPNTDLLAFSYPYGEFDLRSVDIVSQHYSLGFATDDGSWPSGGNHYAIRRVQVRRTWDMAMFVEQLNIFFSQINAVVQQANS